MSAKRPSLILVLTAAVSAYAGALQISSVSPASGSVAGGTTVVIKVADFVDGPGVTVHMPNRATVVSTIRTTPTSTSITILTPAYIPGPVDIEVIDHDGNATTKAGAFEYFAAPTVYSVYPKTGALVGGNYLSITGRNFTVGAVEVRFGNVLIPDVQVNSAGSGLGLISPPGTAGPVTVTVTNVGLGSTTTTFTYVPLSLTSVTPDQGVAALENTVVIDGAGLSPRQAVYFGGLPAYVKSESPDQLTVAPQYTQTPGVVDVTVESPDGSTATLPGAFVFRQSRPQFSVYQDNGKNPPQVPTSGQVWISIVGEELDIRNPTLLVGRTPAFAYRTYCSGSQCSITCLAPPGFAGPADVTFIGGDGGKFTMDSAITYVQAPGNDNCATAYPLLFDGPMYFELNRANPESTQCANGDERASVWYRFTPTEDGYLDVFPATRANIRIDLLQDCCGEPVAVPTGCFAPYVCLSSAPVRACEDYLIRVESTNYYPSNYDAPTTIYAAFRPVPGAAPCTAEGEGEGEGATEGAGEGEGEGSAEGEGEGEGEGTSTPNENTVDTDHDGRISLSELLRLVQFYRLGIGCGVDTEDGFDPGGADQTCPHYSADYNPTDWQISLSEALRAIQLYSAGAYHPCPEGEDGFCPGP